MSIRALALFVPFFPELVQIEQLGRSGNKGLNDKRLKMKVMEPLSASSLWGRDTVFGDVVIVSKLTPDGFVPSEIHLTSIKD